MGEEIDIVIDVRSIIPLSEQIRAQIADLIRAGRLPDGARLPTVRDLASDLGVAVNTVNKSYAELDRDGLIVSKRRAGTRVTRPTQMQSDSSGTRRAASLLVETARREQLDEETVIALVREALRSSVALTG